MIDNLNIVLGTVSKHPEGVRSTVSNLEILVTGLKNRADPLAGAIADISNGSAQAGLLSEDRPLLQQTIGKLETIQQPFADDPARLDTLPSRSTRRPSTSSVAPAASTVTSSTSTSATSP